MNAVRDDRAAPLPRRIAAGLIDGGVILVIAAAALLASGQPPGAALTPGTLVLISAVAMFYRMFTEGTALMATPGKRVLGLAVRPPDNGRLDFAVAALRAWPWWLTGALTGIDPRLALPGALLCAAALVPIAIGTERRGLHDRMAGTRVIVANNGNRRSP